MKQNKVIESILLQELQADAENDIFSEESNKVELENNTKNYKNGIPLKS